MADFRADLMSQFSERRGLEDSHERLNSRKGSYEPAIEKGKKEKAKMHRFLHIVGKLKLSSFQRHQIYA